MGGLVGVSDKIHDMGTVRGRIGYAFDQVLIYGTGGYAWADDRLTATALGVSTLNLGLSVPMFGNDGAHVLDEYPASHPPPKLIVLYLAPGI